MEPIYELSLDEFIRVASLQEVFNDELVIVEARGEELENINPNPPPFHLNACCILMTCQGELSLSIDYLTYRLKKNMVLQVFNHHIWEGFSFTDDFRGFYIIISVDLLSYIIKDSRGQSNKIIKTQIPPLVEYDDNDMRILLSIIKRMRGYIADRNHLFREIMVKNTLSTFMFEMLNINLKKNIPIISDSRDNAREELLGKFIELLLKNCKEKHEVSYYATELCVTPTYLSRILKSLSGKTVNKWISNAIIGEAKILLRKPNSVIQQVSDELHFSDQSAFGKFFKKNTGKSPLEYKRSYK